MSLIRLPLVFVLAAQCFAALSAHASDFIAVSADMAQGYTRPIDASGKLIPQAYIMAEGQFLQGATRDKPLERTKFKDLLQPLARNLAKQQFFPASDPNDSDLVLVVHWGATLVYTDPIREQTIENMNAALRAYSDAAAAAGGGVADPGDINTLSDALDSGVDAQAFARKRNAALLGYTGSLRKLRSTNQVLVTNRERTLVEELNEERYFLVVMAYDFKSYQEKKPKLLWVTRLSVRSPGNNFGEAALMLSEAGANVFGQKLDNLSHVRGRVRSGEVILGDLKVLGEE